MTLIAATDGSFLHISCRACRSPLMLVRGSADGGVRTITNRQETVPTDAIIAIASGWGGVGEGEIAANLALLLAKKDTGVLADLHLGGMVRTKLSARGRL